jgi:hypothetical protein
VRCWQEVILGIAKEEMAHLITVQNVLRLIGGPLNLDRNDYPWDAPFYPGCWNDGTQGTTSGVGHRV